MTRQRIENVAIATLIITIALIIGLALDARAATRPTSTPYTTRVLEQRMLSWTRRIFPAEDLIGTDCSRYGRTYQCYVDVHDPSDGFLSHGFYECAYQRTIRANRLRVKVPETAWVLVARRGAKAGGVRCGHDLHPVSVAKPQPKPDAGVSFTYSQIRRAVYSWLVWSYAGTGLHVDPYNHRIRCRVVRGHTSCVAAYRLIPNTGPHVARPGWDAFPACYASDRVTRHRWWITGRIDRVWIHVGRSTTVPHADGGLVCSHRWVASDPARSSAEVAR